MPSKKKLRHHIHELEDQVSRLESDLNDERSELRTYNRLLTRIRMVLTDRVPSREIGITFSGWVDHVARLVEKYVPIHSQSDINMRISAIVKLVEELKMEAVANHSFEQAAYLRDIADRLLQVSDLSTKGLVDEKV